MMQLLQKIGWQFLKKLKIALPIKNSNPASRYISKRIKNRILKEMCAPMFTAALFIITKRWKQSKRPQTHKWIKKTQYIYTQLDIIQLSKRRKYYHVIP